MKWDKVKFAFPERWIMVEALETYRNSQNEHVIESISIVDTYENDNRALLDYFNLREKHKQRDLYIVHTSMPELNIFEHTKYLVQLQSTRNRGSSVLPV